MRLQESPPIQPRRNHRDRAWSMFPVLQAWMYCLRQRGRHVFGGKQGNSPRWDNHNRAVGQGQRPHRSPGALQSGSS